LSTVALSENVFRGQQLRGGFDGGDGGDGPHGKREILAALLGGIECYAGDCLLESRFLNRNLVNADRKICEEVVTGRFILNHSLAVGSGVLRAVILAPTMTASDESLTSPVRLAVLI
jgi:hypothetical protein